MSHAQPIPPVIGNWYSSHGVLFEVVAVDDDEQFIEIQHADGDIEEIDRDDWLTRVRAGSLHGAEPPEDVNMARDSSEEADADSGQSAMEEARGLRADSLQDLDLFD